MAKKHPKGRVKDSCYSEAAIERYIGVLNFLSKSLKSTCERVSFSNIADYMTAAFPKNEHCVERAQIRSFFWSVFFCIQSEYRIIQTIKNYVFGPFHAVELFLGPFSKTLLRDLLAKL